MPYRANMHFDDLYKIAPIERVQRRIVKRMGDFTRDRAAAHTPVAKLPEGVTVHDRGRMPGTLRSRWRVSAIKTLPDGTMTIDVYNTDRIAKWVEDDTQPHLIRPRTARVLAFPSGGQIVFATIVHHPGTTGKHMLKIAIHEARAELHRIGREELARWARGDYDRGT